MAWQFWYRRLDPRGGLFAVGWPGSLSDPGWALRDGRLTKRLLLAKPTFCSSRGRSRWRLRIYSLVFADLPESCK